MSITLNRVMLFVVGIVVLLIGVIPLLLRGSVRQLVLDWTRSRARVRCLVLLWMVRVLVVSPLELRTH